MILKQAPLICTKTLDISTRLKVTIIYTIVDLLEEWDIIWNPPRRQPRWISKDISREMVYQKEFLIASGGFEIPRGAAEGYFKTFWKRLKTLFDIPFRVWYRRNIQWGTGYPNRFWNFKKCLILLSIYLLIHRCFWKRVFQSVPPEIRKLVRM